MPAISTTGTRAATPRKRKPATDGPPAPRRAKPTGVFAQPPAQKPFAAQQQQAAAKTRTAVRRLPAPVIAAPPVIQNPTPAQVHAATHQIVKSLDANLGSATGAARNAARDQLLDQIAHDPRLAAARASIRHYAAAQVALNTPASILRNAQDRVAPGRGPTHVRLGVGPINLATVDLTPAEQGASRLLAAAAPGLHSADAQHLGASILGHAGGDLVTLGKGPFVGAYEAAHAIGSDVLVGPTAIAHGHSDATTKLAEQIGKGYVQEARHPVKSFETHPILTALDIAGAISALGRTGGALARGAGAKDATGLRGALDAGTHTVRPPVAMVDDPNVPPVPRTYSKDLTRRAAQVRADRKREPLRDADGNPVMVVDRGRTVPVLKATDRERTKFANQRGDFIASRTNLSERQVRAQQTRGTRVKGARGQDAQALVSMVVEGQVTSAAHLVSELRAQRTRLAAELAKPDQYRHSGAPGGLEAARANLAQLDRILGNPKLRARARDIVAEGERHGGRLNTADAANQESGILNAAAAKRSRLTVPAIEHMGARHFTVEEHQALERQAAQVEKAAQERYRQAKTPAARQAALADVAAARGRRIAVSGREPDGVRQHEAAQVGKRAADQKLASAQKTEDGAMRRVQALAAQHRSERGREAHNGPVAAYYVGDRRFTLRQDAEAYAKSHGVHPRALRRVALSSDEARRVGELSQARRRLANAKQARRAAQRDVQTWAKRAKAAPLPDTKAGIRYGESSRSLGFDKPAGAFLSNDDIENLLRSRGRSPDTVAYLPHRVDITGNRAHHAQFRPDGRPVLDAGETRTGEARRLGVTESSARLIHDQGVRQAVKLNQAKAIDHLVSDHGLRHPASAKSLKGARLTEGEQRIVAKGGYFTMREATELADRLEHDSHQSFTPMRAYADKLDPATKAVIRDKLQAPGGMDALGQRLLNDRIIRPDDKIDPRARNVVLVPTELVDRLNEHLAVGNGTVERFFQYLNKPFRYAVLPTPHWLGQNFAESFLVRLPTKGSGLINVPGLLVDITAMNRSLKDLEAGTAQEQAAAAQIRAQQVGGGLFVGGGYHSGVRRTPAEVMPKFAQRAYGQLVAKLPVVDQMAQMTQTATHWLAAPLRAMFEANLHLVENPAKRAAYGHEFRADIQAVTGSWIKTITLSKEAVHDANRGLVNTPAQQRLMHAQYELLGKYGGQSPRMRAATQSIAPFLPWALNAARFVYWTMPAHNTVKTALLLKTQQVLQNDWKQIHANTPPGSLRDAIPNGKGGWIDLARDTPYGLTEPIMSGDNLQALTGEFTPQFGGMINALQGRDAFGGDLEVAPTASNPEGKAGTAQDIEAAVNEMLTATVPYLSTAQRLRERGETAYGDSNVLSPKTKPGTSHGMSALDRTFNPLRPTYLRAQGGQVVTAPSASASAPESRTQQILQRRAQLLSHLGGESSRMRQILERRAQLLARGGR